MNPTNKSLRIGIVGAGLNSDYHINFAKAHQSAQVVGVADADFGKAQECAKKHGIEGAFGSVKELLEHAAPDIVHVITPPKTHVGVAREVLEAGRHAIVEKPLALSAQDGRLLYEIADRHGVQLCAMHNHFFDPCMQRAHEAVTSGALGTIVNVESYYGLNTNIPAFRDYPRPNVLPWLYSLPGGVYQDFLPHPLYVLLEYTGAPRSLTVMSRATGVLPQRLPDEIRILVDGERAFGTVTFSFAANPHLHFVRIYGTKMMVEVDFNTMTTVTHPVSSLPKAAQKATYNLNDSWQRTQNTISNMFRFVKGDLKPYHGMKNLIHDFYDSIQAATPPPVSRTQALNVLDTMDAVLHQLKYEPLTHESITPAPRPQPQGARKILVTGGTGFLGTHLVKRLIGEGNSVRVLARKLSRVDGLAKLGAEVLWGDVADLDSFDLALAGCDVVIHLAAGTSGSEKDSQTATLQGTRNLLELCSRHKPQRLIYISSCGVYGVADYEKDAVVTEQAGLERFPERRGAYSASKQQAEKLVQEYMSTGGVPVVILRPGTIYGPGTDVYTPMLGFAVGSRYIVIGNGQFTLPYVYVDNVVEAIVKAAEKKEAEGEIFNVVDPEALSKRRYMDTVIRRIDPRAKVSYLPYAVLDAVVWGQELLCRALGRPPVLTRYRLSSSQKSVTYDCTKIMTRLNWTPPVSQQEALALLVASKRGGDDRVNVVTHSDDSQAA
jgi:nucleoside-diphosphate-sugar epimerase/predicted dehydrogenase